MRFPNLPVKRLCVDGAATPVRVYHARSFIARLFGLLGRRPLGARVDRPRQPDRFGNLLSEELGFDDNRRSLADRGSCARVRVDRRRRLPIAPPKRQALGLRKVRCSLDFRLTNYSH